jgi:hypothetical protein
MKNITKVFVVLLVISIVFVAYNSFYLEGFEQVPSCGVDSGAPACYATVRDDYSGFADIDKNDYILKTQIVTPVCPNSPYTDLDEDLPSFKDEKDKEKDKKIHQRANSNFFPNGHFGNDLSFNVPEPDSKPSTQADYKENSPLLNNQPIPDYNLSMPKLNVPAEPASSNDTKSQPSNADHSNSDSNDSCPPCPACKRCPEPVVECKKVVNYKRAGSENLPVPMISDFSKF